MKKTILFLAVFMVAISLTSCRYAARKRIRPLFCQVPVSAAIL